MWATIVFLAALTALFAYVWVREHRHPVAPGRHPSADAQVNSHGRWWDRRS
jgi:hypothetical protein